MSSLCELLTYLHGVDGARRKIVWRGSLYFPCTRVIVSSTVWSPWLEKRECYNAVATS